MLIELDSNYSFANNDYSNIIIEPSLPNDAERDMVCIVSTIDSNVLHCGFAQPISPALGDIWMRTIYGTYAVQATASILRYPPYMYIAPSVTLQWNGSQWIGINSYKANANGEWVLFTKSPSSLSWEEISLISSSGYASSYFLLGDTRNVLINNISYEFEMVGFNHDDLADGSGKAGITFFIKNCLNELSPYNSSDTNVGGYPSSVLYSRLNSTVINQIQSDVRAVIKPVTKLTSEGDTSSAISSTTENIWAASEIEILGLHAFAYAGEGRVYARYNTPESRIKTVNGVATTYHLRSPYWNTNFASTFVSETGSEGAGYASAQRGVAFGFCV